MLVGFGGSCSTLRDVIVVPVSDEADEEEEEESEASEGGGPIVVDVSEVSSKRRTDDG